MKTLIAFYSRHEHTKRVAKKIAKSLKADIEQLKDKKDRSHLISWQKSAFDEEIKTPTEIEKTKYNPMEYDLVVVGTPIWDGIAPAVWAYLNGNKFKKVAFFITFHAAAENASYFMGTLSKKPIATLEIQDRQIDIGEDDALIKKFCNEIKKNR
jgi:flavodoxin